MKHIYKRQLFIYIAIVSIITGSIFVVFMIKFPENTITIIIVWWALYSAMLALGFKFITHKSKLDPPVL